MSSTELFPRELQAKLQTGTVRLLDVRQPEENELVRLPDSRLIPLGELWSRRDELLDWIDQDVVVYCHHGVRSRMAIEQLKQAGFTRLQNLVGGIDSYSVEVDPNLPRY